MSFLKEYIENLRELVNLDAGTANTAGVTRAAQIMKGHFESIGFTCELVDFGPRVGAGLLARNKPDATHYDVLFNAHLDTVFPDGTAAARPFSIEGFLARGPGCADCKAGVLSIFYALKMARPEDLERLSIAVAYNPDEETGSLFSDSWLSALGEKSDCALVCEAARPNGELVRARKGISIYTVKFTGRAAHAGNNPQDGRSALLAAARFVLEADKRNDFKNGSTITAGILHSGTVSNVIPENAYVEFDTRYWTNEEQQRQKAALKELAARNWGEDIVTTFEQNTFKAAMPFSDATKALVEKMSAAAREVGFTAEFVEAGGASDGNNLALMGTPVIDGCGPSGGGYHTDHEYLRLDTVEERSLMLKKFLELL